MWLIWQGSFIHMRDKCGVVFEVELELHLSSYIIWMLAIRNKSNTGPIFTKQCGMFGMANPGLA